MICPECHAEYLNHIKECGDCEVSLINASILDLPIPEMTWLPLPPFKGKVYADMAAELLEGPAPYGLPVVPIAEKDGGLIGLTTHLDWLKYCGQG